MSWYCPFCETDLQAGSMPDHLAEGCSEVEKFRTDPAERVNRPPRRPNELDEYEEVANRQ